MKAMWALWILALAACDGGNHGRVTEVTPETVSPADGVDAGAEVASIDPDAISIDTPCIPNCGGKECGDDACGGSCGSCFCGESCMQGECVNTSCAGKQCGDDGCGGICGVCPECTVCDPGGYCVPTCCGHSCSQLWDCIQDCHPANDECATYCYYDARSEAQWQWDALAGCLVDHGAGDCDPGSPVCQWDILVEHCAAELKTCVPDMILTCAELIDCYWAEDGDYCEVCCLHHVVPTAQVPWPAYKTCIGKTCGMHPYQSCKDKAHEGSCAQEYQACIAP